jgi:hypothetical protein
MITNSNITTAVRVPDPNVQTEAKPGDRGYAMTVDALLDFDTCPARFLAREAMPEPRLTKHAQALRLHHLAPQEYAARYRVRPGRYATSVLQCPSCGSEAPSKLCTKCNLSRKSAAVTKPWAPSALFCKAWAQKAEAEGAVVIRPDEHDAVTRADARLLADPEIAALWVGRTTTTRALGTWHDAETGLDIPLAADIDYVPAEPSAYDDCLGLFVVTSDASVTPWSRSAFYAGQHARAALALDLWNAASEVDRSHVLFVLSESAEPHEPGRRLIGPKLLDAGRRYYQQVLTRYAVALASNTWPSYDPEGKRLDAWSTIDLEPWMYERPGGTVTQTASQTHNAALA